MDDVAVYLKRKAVSDEDLNDDMNKKMKGSGDYRPGLLAPSTCKIQEVKITNGMKVKKGQLLLVFEQKVTPILSHLPTISEKLKSRIKRFLDEKCELGVYSVEDVAWDKDAAENTPIARLDDDGLENFKKFDIVKDHSGHLFATMNSPMNQPSKDWENKMQEQWRIIEEALPDTTFVRVYESRMDLLRVAIIGPKGTPYHDGLFFFDLFFPSTYPDCPPLVRYHSGGLSIHPNVFNCGDVRLQRFRPIRADRNPMWHPGTWNVLQLLVSMQNLILTKEPYFKQRGFAAMKGSVDGEKLSLLYNENTVIKSLKTMVYTMNKPPKNFEDLVVGHFRKHVSSILKACEAYTEGGYFGSEEKTSIKFRNDVAKRVKPLVAAFNRIGAMEAQNFSYLSEKRTRFPDPDPAAPAPAPAPAREDFSEWHKCHYTAHTAYEVVEVLVKEGTEVKKGDPFFVFKTLIEEEEETPEDVAFKAALASSEKRIAELEAGYKAQAAKVAKWSLVLDPLLHE